MKSRIEIKEQAKAGFYQQRGIAILAFVLYSVISGVLSGATVGLAALFLMPPMTVGYAYFSLRIYRGETSEIMDMLAIGFRDYLKSLVGILWMMLFTFLWSLLLIVPGIVKAIAYSMTPYILAERDDVSAQDALKLSMDMTYGYKMDIFMMGLSFIGWWILSALTFGILAFFFTGPYTATSFAGLYEELKAIQAKEEQMA
ncbi:MAG TPA: DUF975 family protein [Candidatus Limiplasma sp.]|nr:DUF975 family protein [Candidatus Limiplasma sp.]HRX08362.1 DUF975 family protein [Candidatus Limiplasma sp.]